MNSSRREPREIHPRKFMRKQSPLCCLPHRPSYCAPPTIRPPRLVNLTAYGASRSKTMDDHDARNHTTIDSPSDSPLRARTALHHLSAADRDLLAERIALIDGVTCTQAHRQIEEFMSTDWDTLIGSAGIREIT